MIENQCEERCLEHNRRCEAVEGHGKSEPRPSKFHQPIHYHFTESGKAHQFGVRN